MDILELTGCTREEILAKVVDRAAERLLEENGYDEDGNEDVRVSALARRMDAKIKEYIDAAVQRIGDEHVKPNVDAMIAGWVLQQTTGWGEKKGEPVSLTEYIVQRANAYMTEDVDFKGNTQQQEGYNWKKAGQRIAVAVDQHLQYHIKSAMETVLKDANAQLTEGIVGTVKAQLQQITKNIKVGVTVGR